MSKRSILLGLWISFCSVAALPLCVQAQHPLCPAPSAENSYYYTCRPGTNEQVAKFLYDFSVRHLLKSNESFEIETDKLLAVLALEKILDSASPEIAALLKDRPVIQFTPLDRSTGEFISKGADSRQKVTVTNDKLGLTLELSIPEVVQGLYWRSPAHLELQFYKGHGIRFHLSGPAVAEYEDGLQCVSISQTRVRATTSDPTRYLMNLFERCP